MKHLKNAATIVLATLLCITLIPTFTLSAFADEIAPLEEGQTTSEGVQPADEEVMPTEEVTSPPSEPPDPIAPEEEVAEPEAPETPDGQTPEVVVEEPGAPEALETTLTTLDEGFGALAVENTIVLTVNSPLVGGSTVTIYNTWTTNITVTHTSGSTTDAPITLTPYPGASPSTYFVVSPGDTIEIKESTADTTFRFWRNRSLGNPTNPLVAGAECSITSMPTMDAFTSDPAGTTAGNDFFARFNDYGSLTSLPAGSFNTSKITTTNLRFFAFFNNNGKLQSLPAGSFNTAAVVTPGYEFFSYFNNNGPLTSLPAGSFNTENISATENNFFNGFNSSGALTSLPQGSFKLEKITATGNSFFASFNAAGNLQSLPYGSFRTGDVATAGNNFFSYFNASGALTSLPGGSFDTSSITAAGTYFFSSFNSNGDLTSLPEGSFNTSGVTGSIGGAFFSGFNENGDLTSLPLSFALPTAPSGVIPSSFCENMFKNSALTKGNEMVPLYFAEAASETFTGTNITPASPPARTTVWVASADYDIATDPSTNQVLNSRIVGYVSVDTLTVKVTNLGPDNAGIVTIALGGAGVADFTLSDDELRVDYNSPVTFTVTPKTGLAVGSYTATVNVASIGAKAKTLSFDITFEVLALLTYKVTKDFGTFTGSGTANAVIDAKGDTFKGISLNGQPLGAGDFGYDPSSETLTLSEAYLKRLPNGDYVFAIEYLAGFAYPALTVDVADTTPPATVDKTKLQAEETSDVKLNKADYTPETWNAFELALQVAQEVLANPNATQAEVDAALKALEDARNNLKPVSKDDTEPGSGTDPGKGSGKNPATGDTTNMLGTLMAFLVAGCVLTAIVTRKARSRKTRV